MKAKILMIVCAFLAFSCDDGDTKSIRESSIEGKWNLTGSYAACVGESFEKGQYVWYVDMVKGELKVESNLKEYTPILPAGTYKMHFTDSTIISKGFQYYYKVENAELFIYNSIVRCGNGIMAGGDGGGYIFERD